MTGPRDPSEPGLVEDRAVLDELDPAECLQLLATVPIGRIAVGRTGDAPLVMPVNYALDDEVVVFRSDDGDKLRAMRDHPVTFQVDAFDPYHRTGWSVMIHGVAENATDDQIEHAAVRPWAPGRKASWLQIRPGRITGRRLRLVDTPRDPDGYL